MEALSCLLWRAGEGGYLSSFKVRDRDGEGVEVSYFSFVNDTFMSCEVTHTQMTCLSLLFIWNSWVSLKGDFFSLCFGGDFGKSFVIRLASKERVDGG